MALTTEQLYKIIKEEDIILKNVTDTLLELDTTPSTATQAYLNDLLIDLYDRIASKPNNITVEAISNEAINCDQFVKWIENNFTNYSFNMFKREIDARK